MPSWWTDTFRSMFSVSLMYCLPRASAFWYILIYVFCFLEYMIFLKESILAFRGLSLSLMRSAMSPSIVSRDC